MSMLIKKYLVGLIFLLFGLFTNSSHATHLVSVDGYAECVSIGQNQRRYKVTFVALRDATASTVILDSEIDIGVYSLGNGNLVRILKLSLVRENVSYRSVSGQASLFIGEYEGLIDLTDLAGGYVLQFQRCCLPATNNLVDDQGIESLIFVPAGMQVGQHTLKFMPGTEPLLEANQSYVFDFPWTHNLYDSVRYESKDFYAAGDISDPMPQVQPNLSYSPKGNFKNGAAAGNPFGTAGTFTKLTDSTFEIKLTQSGYYIYPVSSTCYLNGVSFKQTVLFPAITVDTAFPVLWLEYVWRTSDQVFLKTHSKYWNNPDSVMLQRRDPGMPQNVYFTLQDSVAIGLSQSLSDSGIDELASYWYRIKLVSNGQTHYSNQIFVASGKVSVKKIQENQNNIQVYPNPGYKQVIVRSSVPGPFELYSINGQNQLEGVLSEGENILNIEGLPEGIYFLKTEFETVKIVVGRTD